MRPLTPTTIAAPLANYAHGIEVSAGARMIRTSGQLGLAADGSVPDSVAAQAAICFANIRAILAEGGTGLSTRLRGREFRRRCGQMRAR